MASELDPDLPSNVVHNGEDPEKIGETDDGYRRYTMKDVDRGVSESAGVGPDLGNPTEWCGLRLRELLKLWSSRLQPTIGEHLDG